MITMYPRTLPIRYWDEDGDEWFDYIEVSSKEEEDEVAAKVAASRTYK